MCEAEGMALAPWGALGRGLFKPEDEHAAPDREGRKGQQTDSTKLVTAALEKIAKKKDTLITSIALAYVMHKSPHVYPIVGGRKVDHLKGNIAALKIELSDEEIDEIDGAAPFDIGFPYSMLYEFGGQKYNTRMDTKDIFLVKPAAHLDTVQKGRPPKPRQE